jgi:hypothetical protein
MDAIVTNGSTQSVEVAVSSVRKDDLWTLAAFGVLAYMISNVLHEGLGHGGVAWLSGARQITVTSTYMEAGIDTRWILAAGTLVNLAFGVLGLLVLRGMRVPKYCACRFAFFSGRSRRSICCWGRAISSSPALAGSATGRSG